MDTPPKTAEYLRTEAASEIPETCRFFFLKHLIGKKNYTVQKSPHYSPSFPVQTWTCKEKKAQINRFPNPRYRVPIKRMAVISATPANGITGTWPLKLPPSFFGRENFVPSHGGSPGNILPGTLHGFEAIKNDELEI